MLELYDKNIRPNEKKPIDVSVTIYILDNHIVEETENFIMFDTMMYFRRYWNDSRIAEKDRDTVMAAKDLKDKLWTPDLFFVKSFDVPTPNVFVKITSQGTITISEKLLVNWKCPQNLTNFPCDDVACELYIESCKIRD
ncbi:Gamma-aminobutyric acid receptor subunit beta-like protein [Leptotrombidium deliense]|uniref:Gamma-aminobutyric acid receptor subunit beta-like protein n=1 Tax=Leptotrombidium deliense TaxID=299467 RepID=A0A443S2P4_9ACAR|nr:Gamma-aminobutyric acid receptor subunit beta-like protein [Leptotrombidium deliense]